MKTIKFILCFMFLLSISSVFCNVKEDTSYYKVKYIDTDSVFADCGLVKMEYSLHFELVDYANQKIITKITCINETFGRNYFKKDHYYFLRLLKTGKLNFEFIEIYEYISPFE